MELLRRLALAALAFILSDGSLAQTAPQPMDYDLPIVPASDMSTVNSRTPQCAATAIQTLGQAWRVGFTTGGFLPNFNNLPNPEAARPPKMQAVFPKLSVTLPHQPRRVTIVVIDHFSAIPVVMDRNAPIKTENPYPFALWITHGLFVVEHIKAMLQSDGFTSTGDFLTRHQDGREVTIKTVNIDQNGGQTVPLAQKVNRLLSDVRYQDVIVNMSLALLPCPVLQGYTIKAQAALLSGARYTLNDYIKDEADRANMSPEEYAQKLLQRVPPDEPLITALEEAKERLEMEHHTLIAVASSGNFGLNISTIPGALPIPGGPQLKVISVGATTWEGEVPGIPGIDQDRGWSDRGDVTSVGEWFQWPPVIPGASCQLSAPLACDISAWTHPAYRGTSFSAPSVTALLASRLETNEITGQTCIAGESVPFQKNLNRFLDGSGLCVP